MGAGHSHPLYVHGHSPVHRLPPHVKVAAAAAVVLAVAVTPREALWAFAVHAAVVVAVVSVARLRASFVLTRMLVVAPFIVFALFIPFLASGEQVEVVGVEVSREGLWGAWNILAKALLGVAVSVVLAATTEVTRILRGLERLRVPRIFTLIAMFMLRYIEVIAEEVRRGRMAMAARGYDPRWLWQVRPLASSAGSLFIRSYERGERVYDAMLARGFTGTMPRALEEGPAEGRQWAVGALAPAVMWTVAVSAWLLR